MKTLLNCGWWITQDVLATLTLLNQAADCIRSISSQITNAVQFEFQFTERVHDAVGLSVGHGGLLWNLSIGGVHIHDGKQAQEANKEKCGLHGSLGLDFESIFCVAGAFIPTSHAEEC